MIYLIVFAWPTYSDSVDEVVTYDCRFDDQQIGPPAKKNNVSRSRFFVSCQRLSSMISVSKNDEPLLIVTRIYYSLLDTPSEVAQDAFEQVIMFVCWFW